MPTYRFTNHLRQESFFFQSLGEITCIRLRHDKITLVGTKATQTIQIKEDLLFVGEVKVDLVEETCPVRHHKGGPG